MSNPIAAFKLNDCTMTDYTAATTATATDSTRTKTTNSLGMNTFWTHRAMIGLVATIMCLFTIFMFIYSEVPTPYMDEIFHVDQLHNYCAGNFSYWNSKLTTPPGLYLFTIGFFKPFKELYAFNQDAPEDICPLYLARFTNLLFGIANFFLIFLIQCNLNRKFMYADKFKILLSSLATSTLPPLFFFNFLYYTDPGSLFFVLLMYLFDLEEHTYLASLFGLLSLLFRQTNIVWVFFVAAKYTVNLMIALKQRNLSNREIVLHSMINIVKHCAGYLFVAIVFIVFILKNNGIVLGDRNAHEAVLHTGQVHYYLAFVSLFAWPHLLSEFLNSITKESSKFLLKLTAIVIILLCLSNQAHPYLLADNRHYTFYAWRRIFDSSYSSLFLPLYALTAVLMYSKLNHLDQYSRKVFIWFHLACTLISIVPAKLLEFRYFIVPFLIWRLHLRINNRWAFALELASNLFINIATIYIFIFRTFEWPHSPHEKQRLMW